MQTRTIPSAESVRSFLDPLPKEVDVVVIGGGVIGVSTAYHLAKAGKSVLVCEKGVIAGEQSSRNWGWIRQQGRDPAELPIMMESLRIWEGLSHETGEDLGFTQQGCLYLAKSQEEMAGYETWMETAKQHQLDSRLIGKAEIDGMIEGANGQWIGGLWTPGDGRGEPTIAVPRLAKAIARMGVTLREDCAVRTLDLQGGRVTGVVTEHGRVACASVVMAGGAWSSAFLRNHGIALAQLSVRSSVARTNPAPDIFQGNAGAKGFSFRRRRDGGYTIALGDYSEHFIGPESFREFRRFMPLMKASAKTLKLRFGGTLERFTSRKRWSGEEVTPFEQTRVLDPKAPAEAVALMRKRMQLYLPKLAECGIAETWAGMIDATPDAVPVIDHAPAVEGLIIATGFSGHGFGLGPGAGRVIADLVQGKPLGHDISRFRYARFYDGSPIKPGPM